MAGARSARAAVVGTLSRSWDASIGKLQLGVFGELRREFTSADVESFAALSGDDNPIHLDASYAATTPFGGRLVHGLLYASLIPAIFGATIPGCVYVSQNLNFRKPVFLGDAVVARVEVTGIREVPARYGPTPGAARLRQQLLTCATTVRCIRAGTAPDSAASTASPLGELLVVDGEATVLLPPPCAERQPALR